MKNNNYYRQISIALFSSLLLVVIVIMAILFPATPINGSAPTKVNNSLPTESPQTSQEEDQFKEFRNILSETSDQINFQEKVDQNLIDELHNGNYSFENPLIVNDPYNVSPLTALVIFTTSEPTNISIHVDGSDEYTDVDFTFDGYSQEHLIPVYGLFPGRENNVKLTSRNQAGFTNEKQLKITTESLPENLADAIILTDSPDKEKYSPGFNFTFENNNNNQKSAFDINGTFRWFLKENFLLSSEYHFNDRFIFAKGRTFFGDVLFFETNPLGRIYRVFYSPYGVHHDIEQYKNNLLVTGSKGETIEDLIYEIDTSSGKIINSLDLKEVLQRSRQAGFNDVGSQDWLHLNTIYWSKYDDKIIISGRAQSVVAELSWPEGKIDWMLTPHYGWLPMFDQYLLDPIGDNFYWPLNQHAPEILPDQDNNPNTMDILLFDNGNQRFSEADIPSPVEETSGQGFSRMVQFRINPSEMTVQQVWQFGEDYGSLLYSPARGNANLLPNGNRLGFFEIAPLLTVDQVVNATLFEVSKDSQIVWSAQIVSPAENGRYREYRIERMNIYNPDANNLSIGSPVENFIPEDIYAKYNVVP